MGHTLLLIKKNYIVHGVKRRSSSFNTKGLMIFIKNTQKEKFLFYIMRFN